MATSDSGLRDELRVELNAQPEGRQIQAAQIPDRPAHGASITKWAEYVIALGLHPDQAEKYTRQDLKDLAERFGG